jgi:hypothetical protein
MGGLQHPPLEPPPASVSMYCQPRPPAWSAGATLTLTGRVGGVEQDQRLQRHAPQVV